LTARPAGVDITDENAVRDALLNRGWRQGALLPADALALVHLIPFAPTPAVGAEVFGVVISQDCDAVQGSCEAEPAIEIALLTEVEKLDGNFRNLANPRLLHFELQDAQGRRRAVEANVWHRGFIARTELVQRTPTEAWTVRGAELNNLADLFGRRYTREGFPDEFMGRFASAEQALAQLVSKNVDKIHDLYLKVTPLDELSEDDPDGHPYDVTLYVVISDALASDAGRRKVWSNSHLPNLKKAIRQCPGIELEDVIVIDMDEMSLGTASQLMRWDLDPLRAKLAAKARERAAATASVAQPIAGSAGSGASRAQELREVVGLAGPSPRPTPESIPGPLD
jgi:hypothetical protein